MTYDEYFRELVRLLERRVSRDTYLGGFRSSEANDFVHFFCVWVLMRPKVMSDYSPAAIVSVSYEQRKIEYFRAQHRQTPALPWKAGVDDPRMHMQYLDEVMYGPTATAPIHVVAGRDFEDGENPTGKKRNDLDKIDAGIDVEDNAMDRHLLQSLLGSLEPMQQELLVLVDLKGYTVTEAAKLMNIRRERASIALGRARETVRRIRDEWDA
ncbi:MAG: sigma factor-like helix-turn-helix DNA-binding protein [Actinomycetota bacterium]